MQKIKRRTFIQKSLLTSAGSLLLPGFLKAMDAFGIGNKNKYESKKLIIIQLSGGNDGLNMVVPYTNPLYYKARPNLAIPANTVLKATGELGFNPVMKEINDLYSREMVCVINNVGYPHPNRSHFRSMDIWQSASDSNEYLSSGWIGRYLSTLPEEMKKPHHAIEVDEKLNLALKGHGITGMAVSDPRRLHDSLQRGFFRPLAKAYQNVRTSNENLNYIYEIMGETVRSTDYIFEKSKNSTTGDLQKYPNGLFAKNLSTIAKMIRSGLSTQVYYTSLGGFDTHVRQNPQQNRLLKEYSQNVFALVNDLEQNHLMDDVLILTFSEFGRRVAQNASGGTDHGCANNLLLIGGRLKKSGVYNESPDLLNLDHGDLKYTVDFRSVYATVLENHLDMPSVPILGKTFPLLDFV